jgi:apolipoprotein D and lipocalin family protein
MKKINMAGLAVLGVFAIAVLHSCKTIPKGAVAVTPFDSKKYLGRWYEIARMDFRFEKNLKNTTADYSFNANGRIKVVNRGYNYKTSKWKQSNGKAKFVGDENEAKLKVSFFGPFYAGYNVIALDVDYRYALVAGKNLDYLWLLSRQKEMPENIKKDYLQKAAAIGYDTSKLVWVEQDK